MSINYEHYKIFYYVAKYKNLTIAARELNNNQPNISRTIKMLEQELGCKLILRKSRGIDLTPEGENLYFYVSNGIKQFNTAEIELSSFSTLKQGIITVGVSETASYMVLLPAIKAFKAKYPDIKIKLLSHNTATALDLVKQGLVDFSITSLDNPVGAPLVSTTILQYRDLLIGGPLYKGYSSPLSLSEINELPLISLDEESATYSYYKRLFSAEGLTFSPLYEVETTSQLYPMVIYDLGIAFIPPVYVHNALKQELVVELKVKEELPARNICIIENKSRYTNIAAEKLKRFCMAPAEYSPF